MIRKLILPAAAFSCLTVLSSPGWAQNTTGANSVSQMPIGSPMQPMGAAQLPGCTGTSANSCGDPQLSTVPGRPGSAPEPNAAIGTAPSRVQTARPDYGPRN